MRRTLLLLLLVLVNPSLATAQVCTLESGSPQTKLVIVAKPGKHNEMASLFRAKENNEAVRCCVACVPEAGTKVVITDFGMLSHTIRVLDGQWKGCVGDVAMERVKECK